MAGDLVQVKITGLREFQTALRKAESANPKAMTQALKEAGSILPPKIRPGMGSVSAGVGNPTASRTKARIPVRHRASAIAEFSNQGKYGATMTARYGPPPRFGYRVVEDNLREIEDRIWKGIEEVATVNGWFK